MKLAGTLLIAFLLMAHGLEAQNQQSSFAAGTKEDETAIRSIMKNLASDQPDPHVAPDLDWENAFGIRYTNLKKRDAFYAKIVAPQLKNASDNSTIEVKVKFVDANLAVGDEYWHIAGQVYAGETKPGPDRWGRTTYIFAKENGNWTEVIERVADLRTAYFKHYDSLPAAAPVPAGTLAAYTGNYQLPSGKKASEVAVSGDHLTISLRGEILTAIPTSSNEFLVFDPQDLAEYYKVTFAKEEGTDWGYTLAYAAGDPIAKVTKMK